MHEWIVYNSWLINPVILTLQKWPWFYKFEDIFYKYPTIFPLILIESEQLVRYNGISVNDSKLKEFVFDLKETLKAYKEIKDTKTRLLLGNYNGNDNLDSNLYFVFS